MDIDVGAKREVFRCRYDRLIAYVSIDSDKD